MNTAYDNITKAAINNGRKNNRSPFILLITSMQTNDIELKIAILTLINWMFFKCPSEKKLCKFQARLENLGIYDELRLMASEKHPELLK